MIRFCACTKISQSSFENPKSRDSSKLCKLCGGRILVDGPGAQSVSMLSTVGLELLPSTIDAQLTWNWTTASNGRQRAVRRARTSFTAVNRMKSPIKSLKKGEDLDNGAKSTSDMPVSESEKLGVSILGRRFSESIENVPIKKRRFPLVPSLSVPHHSLSYSDASLYQDTVVNRKRFAGIKSSYGGRKADGKNDLEELSEKCCEDADFSGISILAAAACDGNIGGDYVISETSVSKGHSSGGQDIAPRSSKLQFLTGGKEELLAHTSEGSVGRAEVSSSSFLASKESNDIKSDGSCNFGISSNSSHNVPNKTMEPALCDVKFPWDLNTVMDVGESHDDVLNSEPWCSNIGVEAGHNANYEKVRTCEGQVGLEATKISSEFGEYKVNLLIERKGTHGSENIKTGETPDISGDYSTAGYTESKPSFSIAHVDPRANDEHQSEVLISVTDVSEEANPLHVTNKSCAISGYFLGSAGCPLVSLGDSSLSSALLDEEKPEQHCKSFSSEVEIRKSSSHLATCGNSNEQNTSAFEPHHGSVEGIIEPTSTEDKNVASVAEQGNHSDYCMNDVQMALVTETRSLEGEKKVLSCTNLGTIGSGLQSSGNHLAERTPDVLVDGNICNAVVADGASCGANVYSGALHEIDCADADKMKVGETNLREAECEKTDIEGKIDTKAAHMKVDTKAAYMKVDTTDAEMQVDTTDAGMKVDTSCLKVNRVNCNELTDENLNDNKCGFSDYVGKKVLQSKSTDIPLSAVNTKDVASSSQRILRSHGDGHANFPQQLALEDHVDCNYYSDASLNDADQANGMEKVEFLGDDDSQYEDGEFRQPSSDCWLEDGVEDGEVERVDYGSDRDTEIYESAADFSRSVNLQVNSGSLPDASVRTVYRAHVGKDAQNPVSPSIPNGPLIADSIGSAVGKKNVGCAVEEGLKGNTRTEDCSKQLVIDVKREGDTGLGHLTGSRMKMSGWDQLPGDNRSSSNGPMNPTVASINQSHTGASLDRSISSESVRRLVGGSMGRDLSSRTERAQSSEGSQRKDKSYIRTSRSNDHNFNSQVEGDACAPRSIGRNGPSLHLQGGGRGERFHGNSRHDPSGYYCPASFPYPGSRNAAAAAVAKVESNGFVVAPDGTIVKASVAGSSGRLARGSGKASSQRNSQSPMGRGSVIEKDRLYGMPPGRDRFREMDSPMSMPDGRARAGRFGPGMVRRERYHAPISDNIINSPHPGSRHDHSFSPRRRPFCLSRSRSRSSSRSRTHSPPRWTSPRVRNDGRMNNGPSGLRWNSKSPNFGSEAPMARPRPIFRERMASYAPSSRNHPSPPHSSRWIDRSKELPEHFRGHEYRRFSPREFSRGQKYDPINSSKRPKPSEFYQPISPGKFTAFVGFDSGTRHDRRGVDRRAHGDRYEMHHSERQYDDDKMKRFHYNDDVFGSHNLQPKSSDFPGGESPRSFDRNVERQLGDSPWRFKEESGQCEKNGDGKNTSFTPFRVCEGEDNPDTCRRRQS